MTAALGWTHALRYSKHYMKVRGTQNTGRVFYSKEWSMRSGMERKTGKDSTTTTDQTQIALFSRFAIPVLSGWRDANHLEEKNEIPGK